MNRLIAVIILLLVVFAAFPALGEAPLKIGVLAYRPKPLATAQWRPLAAYLQGALKRPVELAVYNHDELAAAAARRSVDVVITTSAHLVLLRHTTGLSAPLATLVSKEGAHELSAYGGVIFTRADRRDIASLTDLAGKRIAAASPYSLGGYQMQVFEMLEAGVPLPAADRLLFTGLPHDRIIEAVLAGRADAGFARTGLIESLAREGRLDPAKVKIINRQNLPAYPFAVSTRLYPEWPVAVMPQVDKDLAGHLAAALFLLPHDSFKGQAAAISGFTVPANYDGVEYLLRRLRLPPFDRVPEITPGDLWGRYSSWIVTLAGSLMLLSAAIAGLVILYRRSRYSLRELERLAAQEKLLLASLAEGVFGIDTRGKCIFINPRALALLGLAEDEVIGKDACRLFHGLREDVPLLPHEKCAFILTLDDGMKRELEDAFIRGDGSTFPVSLAVSAMRHGSAVVGAVVVFQDITERKRAQDALAESEARYRQIVDTAAEGIWVVGLDTLTTFVNSRMAEMLGRSGEEMIGRPLTDFMFEEDAPDHLRKIENRRQGTSESYERRFRRKDGQTVWTHVSATTIFDADRHFNGSFAMFTDITERKRAEEALRESEELFRVTIENMLDPVFITNDEGKFTFICPNVLFVLGHTVKEIQAMGNISKLFGKELFTLETLETRGELHNIECDIVKKDGKRHIFLATVRRVSIRGGTILYVCHDITERKRAEAKVEQLKNYLANIIDSMPSVLVGMDRDEIVTQWNRQAEEIFGISARKAVGRTITELLPDFSPWIKGMRTEIEQQRPASMEKLLIEKEGERCFYDLMLYPLIADGVEGAVVRIEDVTERARIQELMIQTEKMISVGGLAAGMAHEINNPLGIITQAVQNIERRVSPELPANRKAAEELGVSLEGIKAYFERRQIPEFVGSIREASLRTSRIIGNMLRFSRRAGSTTLPASPAGIVEQALELAASDYDLKKKYDFRSIEIIRDYAPDMPEVPMVPVEMEQVMLNLLKNAAQAMILNPPERRPKITLRLRREERYALIEVEDNGPGMGEEVRRRVFEPFFTTKEPGIGTGLGLSVSYMIVTQDHKGLMEVESKPGKGACFRIRLPLKNEAART